MQRDLNGFSITQTYRRAEEGRGHGRERKGEMKRGEEVMRKTGGIKKAEDSKKAE